MIVTLNADARQASNQYDRERPAGQPRNDMERAVNIVRARVIRTAAALLLGVGVAAAPALTYAQHGGFGGGGGGHMGGGGGAHFGGGGHAVAAPHFGGVHMGANFRGPAYGGHYAYGGAHYGSTFTAGHVAGYHGGYYAGSHVGTAYWHGGHYWGGGYWHGYYWPHVWYGPGWAWFYPVLPIGYATFWWGGLPYYYYNNLYYTWSPNYNGYVVTDPPMVGADASGSADTGAVTAAPQADDYAPQAAPAPGAAAGAGGAASDVFVYPRNGQTDQQTSTDRYECHSWAVNQTGFDPTRSAQTGTGSSADYRRAMIACLDARGYSAR